MKPEPGIVPPIIYLQPNEAIYYSAEGSHDWGDRIVYVPESSLQKANAEVERLNGQVERLAGLFVDGHKRVPVFVFPEEAEKRIAVLEAVAKEAIKLCEAGCVEGERRENSLGDLARAALAPATMQAKESS